ncbi:unnamed protein product [Wuchereria bancrofti]|uniref:Uncharacterized protein n=1 Tax=Wuchereria bancrofti TaxID=6293 RepID=A0A3P7GLL0_WUCBA|nr:unnamed protein product [Wuchereria bancrofti]
MSLDNVKKKTTMFTITSATTQKSTTEELFEIPITSLDNLLPICLMALILLTLLLACLYDCKVNRDCCRKRSESGLPWVAKSGIYLYDGETGESRVPGSE